MIYSYVPNETSQQIMDEPEENESIVLEDTFSNPDEEVPSSCNYCQLI